MTRGPMEKHAFEIRLIDLDAAGRDVRFDVTPAWLRTALEDHEANTTGDNGAFVLRASKSGDDVVVSGHLEVPLRIPCARCLKEYDFVVSKHIAALAVPKSSLDEHLGEYEFTAEDADTIPYAGEFLVLDELVHDELVLESPMIPLCSEDCPGIHSAPQSDDVVMDESNVDPRLAPLLKWKATGKKD